MAQLIVAVDLDELLDSVDEMRRSAAVLDELLADVSRGVADLHGTWSGRAATAQAAAQAEWEAGYRSMLSALETMRAAADTAHGNYAGSAATNLRMWEQVR